MEARHYSRGTAKGAHLMGLFPFAALTQRRNPWYNKSEAVLIQLQNPSGLEQKDRPGSPSGSFLLPSTQNNAADRGDQIHDAQQAQRPAGRLFMSERNKTSVILLR